jgi:hypothetical protein
MMACALGDCRAIRSSVISSDIPVMLRKKSARGQAAPRKNRPRAAADYELT